jgi:hypothetical protein
LLQELSTSIHDELSATLEQGELHAADLPEKSLQSVACLANVSVTQQQDCCATCRVQLRLQVKLALSGPLHPQGLSFQLLLRDPSA